MRGRLLAAAAVLAGALLVHAAPARAASQVIALFPPDIIHGTIARPEAATGNADAALSDLLAQAIKEKIQDRLDVRVAGNDEGKGDPLARRRKARALGAAYTLTGSVTRIGRAVTLDLTIAPTEEPGKGRTVVATGTDNAAPAGAQAPGAGIEPGLPGAGAGSPARTPADLPFVYRRLVIEASAKLKLAFFGDEVVGEGTARRRIPKLAGTLARSRSIPGDVVSVAFGDTDLDGRPDVVAAYDDAIAIYRVEGDDLVEKARIQAGGAGLFHVDTADVNRNGIAEIVAVRYLAGKALSDVWEFDGKGYNRIAADIPYFLRVLDLGAEGLALAGQESGASGLFRGPVFRIALNRYGLGERSERETPLPLPDGAWIYSFAPIKHGDGTRFVLFDPGGRIVLLDERGRKLREGFDGVSGTETAPEGHTLPSRLLGADIDGDKNDEVIVVNNLVSAGGFFETIKVFNGAEVLCFAQDGEGLQLAWRTPQIEGSARDSFIVPAAPGKPVRIGIASRDRGKILGQYGEWRILWMK